MSHKSLQAYLDQQNFTAMIFGTKVYDINTLTQAEVTDLCGRINSDLSPENLTCDGELSPMQVRQRFALLEGAIKGLQSMGFTLALEEY